MEKNSEILEMIAKGVSASSIYDAIALMYENRHPGMRCSMLELKDNKLIHGGAPSLPKEYCDALNGLENGSSVGSCGTSTFTGERVLVENIETDPKWARIKDLALPHGMRCCWSEPIKNSKGKVLGAFGMYYNHPALPTEGELADLESAARIAGIVMEREQREIKLRQSEFKYRTLVENLPQRFFLKDKQSVFVSCSNNLAKDLGITPEKIVGTIDNDYFPPAMAERFQQDDQRIMQSGVAEEFEETIIIGGEERMIQTVKVPALDEDGNTCGVLGIFWDITEQKLLEEKYRQAQKMESVGTLVGGVAHEFNNTLAGITGRLFLAQADAEDKSKVLHHLDKISTLCSRASDMVKQLLAFSRKSPVQNKHFDLSAFIKETYKLHKFSVPENIRIETDFSSDALPVLGDASQIQQILVNLLHNARDAVSDVAEPCINLKLAPFKAGELFVHAHPDLLSRDFAHLVIEDNGCGVPEENRDKVFDPFYTTKEVGKGTGLGLAMVYGAVQAHKGVVEVDSELGRYTRIHVYLPLSSSSSQDEQSPSSQFVHGNGETILFVDDQPGLRELGREVLESLGYTVLEASNGFEAIKTYVANRDAIALILLDVVMPVMGGVEAALAIRAMNENAKVIFTTGYDGNDVLDASVIGWAEVISKPYDIDSLSHLIKKTISS